MYLLDTNTCIRAMNDRQSSVARRLALILPDQVALCSVVKAELLFGANKSIRREASLALTTRFFEPFVSYPFDDGAAEIYGQLRARLAAMGRPIGPNDLLIASIALARDLILVTNNTREFSRISELRLDDWHSL